MARVAIDAADLDSQAAYKLLIGSVVPRPIAFVSTRADDGTLNVAPFSFFAALSPSPPTICVSIGRRAGQVKDTLGNIVARGEFVVNIVDEALAERMNLAAGDYPPEADEFTLAGLTPAPSTRIGVPRVAEAPINLECRLAQTLPVGGPPYGATLVIGEIVHFAIRDDLYQDGRIDLERLRPIGRLAGDTYCTVRDLFTMARPKL